MTAFDRRQVDPLDVSDETAEVIAVDLQNRYGHGIDRWTRPTSGNWRADARELVNRVRQIDGSRDAATPWLGYLLIGALVVTAFVLGLLAAGQFASAAPRSAAPVIPAAGLVLTGTPSSGNLGLPSGAPSRSVGDALLPTQDPGEVGGGIVGGTATWCAPTPTHCQSWGGKAELGAVDSFRWGDDPYNVEVCHARSGECVTVRVVSFCACGGSTVIDLSPYAFGQIAPLSVGRIPVTVSDVRGVVVRAFPTPPATETSPWLPFRSTSR